MEHKLRGKWVVTGEIDHKMSMECDEGDPNISDDIMVVARYSAGYEKTKTEGKVELMVEFTSQSQRVRFEKLVAQSGIHWKESF